MFLVEAFMVNFRHIHIIAFLIDLLMSLLLLVQVNKLINLGKLDMEIIIFSSLNAASIPKVLWSSSSPTIVVVVGLPLVVNMASVIAISLTMHLTHAVLAFFIGVHRVLAHIIV
jgi:hypothetical protein